MHKARKGPPSRAGLKPRYAEWTPTLAQLAAPKVLIISNDGREGSAHISQDADVYRVKSPAESKQPWDYYERIATVPAATALSCRPRIAPRTL